MVKSHNVDMINGPIVKNLLAFALPVTLFYVLKTVFHATEHTIVAVAIAFKIQHTINDVFHYFGPRDSAVFVDMAHYKYCCTGGFRQAH